MAVVVMITVGISAVEGLVQACSVHRSLARVVSITAFFGSSTCSCDLSVTLTAIFICSVGSSGSGVDYYCQQVCYRNNQQTCIFVAQRVRNFRCTR